MPRINLLNTAVGARPFRGAPGLLATAIGAGAAGAAMGNADFSSFGLGAIGGLAGGAMMSRAAGSIYSGLNRVSSSQMGSMAGRAVSMGRSLTSQSSRSLIFAGGAMLSGGWFSSMFAGNGSSYKSGFNANRGNSIVR